MKVLDVGSLHDGLRQNITMLNRLGAEMQMIEQSIKKLVALEDSLKGEGGNAIRSFYEECHLPFLQFFATFQNRFISVLERMEAALDALEPDPSGFIRESYLEGEIEQGLTHITQITESLTDEATSIMEQVADIIGLPHLDDSDVHEGVQRAKVKRNNTVTDLQEFDAMQTVALSPIEADLATMESWLTNIESLFTDGTTVMDFHVTHWKSLSAENTLKTDLAHRTVGMMGVGALYEMQNKPGLMMNYSVGNQNSIQLTSSAVSEQSISQYFERGTSAMASSMSTTSKLQLSKAKKKESGFMYAVGKSWNSFVEIGNDAVDGFNERGDKAYDSVYDFVNHGTFGILDGIWSGAVDRSEKKWDSTSDFFNYLTIGTTGMVEEAVNPEDTFSKEHWLNSIGIVTSVIGAGKAFSPKPTGPTNKTNQTTKTTKPDDGKTVGSRTGEPVSYYRVQGGEQPNASQFRIQVDEKGKVVIPNKEANLNISAGSKEHAEYFLHKRGNGAEIIEVKVPGWFDDFVKENAIPQYKYKSNPLNQDGTAPKVVDPSTVGTSYELPPPWIDWIEEYGEIK